MSSVLVVGPEDSHAVAPEDSDVVAPEASRASAGYGRPKRPGWWWKMKKERMRKKKQAAEAQEIPSSAYIEELPDDATVTEAIVAPASQEGVDASAQDAKRNGTRNKRRNNGRRNKQGKVKRDVTEEGEQAKDSAALGLESESITGEPVQEFFAQYEGFVHRPLAKPNSEFNRLGKMMDWRRGDRDRNAAWRQLASAMASQFEGRYGNDVNDLNAWQKLCVRIGITPVPNELEEAKEAVFATHFNLVDLTTLPENEEITTFADEQELSEYTLQGRSFPTNAVADGTLLHLLLGRFETPRPARPARPAKSRRYTRDGRIRPND